MTASLIADVEVLLVKANQANLSDRDSSGHTLIVRISDGDGRTGIGEVDGPPEAVRSLIMMEDLFEGSQGLRGLLIDQDPFELRAIHERLYQATLHHGRRGLEIHALSGIDVALHDLVGKQLGRPVYQLLGGARREAIVPYATIWPGAPDGRSLEELMGIIEGQLGRAIELGFRAVKMELIFGHVATDRQLIDCIREGRRAVGDDITLMLDFGYRWHDWRAALWTLDRVQDCDIYFAEATLQHDDLVGHAKLAARVETRLAGAELAATVFECREWIERGGVDVLQPDVSRSGGLTELVRIAELAAAAGVLVVPHGWKTGITAAASRHFQAAVPNVPFVETLVPELWPSPLAADLVTPRPHVCDGAIALPDAPGLGIELVPQTLERWRLDPMV